MTELADVADLKSADGNIVWVQVPLTAPNSRFLDIEISGCSAAR